MGAAVNAEVDADQTPTPRRATAFGGFADDYERGRPDYPAEAVSWLAGSAPLRILELGAGTGKLTRALIDLGHHVISTDPDPAMLEVLEREIEGAVTAQGTAEDIEVPDQSIDLVIAAQCFHWFDPEQALPEIARVLKPGGRIALIWNERDARVPWVRRLGSLIGAGNELRDPTSTLLDSELFVEVRQAEFKHRQHLDQHTILDLARSYSSTAVLDEAGREQTLAEVASLYDDYGRGMDGMLLPWFTRCFTADVVDIVLVRDEPEAATSEQAGGAGQTGQTGDRDPLHDTMPRGLRGRVRPAGPADLPLQTEIDDSQMILIDFR